MEHAADRSGRPNDPFVQLERSHRRLEDACDALSIAARDRDIETVTNICAFFARQVRRHEEDEELSLFPRLTSAGARAIIEGLAREHREHEALHARLERAASGRSEEGETPRDQWSEIETIAEELRRRYRVHIEREEKELFPTARQLLSPGALDEVLKEMSTRRGRERG